MNPTQEMSATTFWVLLTLILVALTLWGAWQAYTTKPYDGPDDAPHIVIPCDHCQARVNQVYPTTRRQYVCRNCLIAQGGAA